MEQTPTMETGSRWGLLGAVGAVLTASVCCVGPLVLLSLGVSGAWIGNLTALEPYRPIFTVLTLSSLGFAFYRVYRKPKAAACAPGSTCSNPRRKRIDKAILWIMTVFIIGLLAFPYATPYLSAGGDPGQRSLRTSRVVLNVRNMTCSSCVVTVRKSLIRLEGVKEAVVTLDPPRAVVAYDPRKISTAELTEATTKAGYPATAEGEEYE